MAEAAWPGKETWLWSGPMRSRTKDGQRSGDSGVWKGVTWPGADTG